MDVQLIPLAPIRVVMIRHRGPYDELSLKFDQLWSWANRHGVPGQRTIGIYWDNPDFVSASRLRSAACIEIDATCFVPAGDGLAIEVSQIAAGTYATTRFVGPYEDLAPVWSNLTRYIENGLRRRISNDPAFEIYVNDASDTPPQQLITELYMPVL